MQVPVIIGLIGWLVFIALCLYAGAFIARLFWHRAIKPLRKPLERTVWHQHFTIWRIKRRSKLNPQRAYGLIHDRELSEFYQLDRRPILKAWLASHAENTREYRTYPRPGLDVTWSGED